MSQIGIRTSLEKIDANAAQLSGPSATYSIPATTVDVVEKEGILDLEYLEENKEKPKSKYVKASPNGTNVQSSAVFVGD